MATTLMRFSAVLAGSMLALVGACASTSRAPSDAASSASLVERVAALLARRHVSPPASPALLSARLFDQLGPALRCTTTLPAGRADLLTELLHGDIAFVERAAAACAAPVRTRAETQVLALKALARAYDPHSRYLTPEELMRFQAQAHAIGADAAVTRHQLVEHQGRRIGLVRVPSFYLRATRSISGDLRRACIDLRAHGAEALVLDLRGNPGGVQREAVLAFGVLAGEGLVAQLRRRDREPELLLAPRELLAWSGPLLVHIDVRTASVAELLAAALQDHGRALLIGQRSYGKGTGQTLVPLTSPRDPQEGAVDVTDRRFYRLDGRALQREGVTPDIALPGLESLSERTRADALLAEPAAPVLAKRAFQVPRAPEAAEALQAAIDYVQSAGLAAAAAHDAAK